MSTIKGIKIVSDGTIMGTKVFSAEGEDLTKKLQIRSIEWSHEAPHGPIAIIKCLAAEIEVERVNAELRVGLLR